MGQINISTKSLGVPILTVWMVEGLSDSFTWCLLPPKAHNSISQGPLLNPWGVQVLEDVAQSHAWSSHVAL